MTDKKRGRRRLAVSVLRPDGLTPEMYNILKIIADERGISIADVRREFTADVLRQMGYSDEDLGLADEAEAD